MRLLILIEMQARELMRRRTALALLVAIPLAFTGAQQYSNPYGDPPLQGGIGMTLAMTGMTLFSVLASRRVDPRLVLAGYRPWQLAIARFVLLLLVAGGLGAIFLGYLLLFVDLARPWLAVLGIALVAAVSVPLGLLVATVVRGELEGILVIIGVVGVEESLSLGVFGARLLPHYGAARYLVASWDGFASVSGLWALYSVAWVVGLLGLALALRHWRPAARGLPAAPAD